MLNALKGKLGFGKKEGEVIGSPIEGKAVAISEVSDPTFGQEILGKGMAVIPTVGKVVAPVDGRIEMIFDTKHAISMKTAGGAELLIHIGLDTVNLKGEPFTAHTTNPVPFILVNADPSYKLREGGCLADIAPTLIELMGMEQPKEMTGKSLLLK